MKKLPFTGSGVAMVTPFTQDNTIDYESVASLIEMHIKYKTDCIIACGTTGEASVLTDDEQENLIRFCVQCANGRIPIIAGAGSNNTKALVTKAQRAEAAGADGILSVTPFYNKANYTGLIGHYKALAKAVKLPIILYNVPSRTGMNMPVPAYLELSEEENIVGVKEASGNIAYVSEIRSRVPSLAIYAGNDDMTVPVMSLGGVGVISVLGNILPDKVSKMCSLALSGKIIEAGEMQNELLPLIKELFFEVNPIPVKNAMRRLGYIVGSTRLPLGKPDEEKLDSLMNLLINRYGAEKLI